LLLPPEVVAVDAYYVEKGGMSELTSLFLLAITN